MGHGCQTPVNKTKEKFHKFKKKKKKNKTSLRLSYTKQSIIFFLIEFYIINVLIDTYKQKNIYIIKFF